MPNSDALARKNTVLKGYAAFNERDWDALEEVLCDDVVWHPMDGGAAINGRDEVISYLQGLGDAEVDLMGMALQGNAAITVDVSGLEIGHLELVMRGGHLLERSERRAAR
jgi:ketosteroid isomerase-like protein